MRASFRKLREGDNDNGATDCDNDKDNDDRKKKCRGGDHGEIKSRSSVVKFAVKKVVKVFGALLLIGKSLIVIISICSLLFFEIFI